MKLSDVIKKSPLEGIFKMNVLNKDGRIIKTYYDPNLVVSKSKEIVCKLVGGGGSPLVKIGLGTGTAAPDPADTGLTNPAYYSFTSVEYPDTSTVTFNWYIGYDQLVGVSISEFGLFNDNDELFCRRVYDPIPKNADMAFSGSWAIRMFTSPS